MLEPGAYIPVKEALVLLPVGKSTMYRLLEGGEIEGTRISGRVLVLRASLEQYARTQTIRPRATDPDAIRARIEGGS